MPSNLKIEEFKNPYKSWDWYAERPHPLQAVLDPLGSQEKNEHLDKLHKDWLLKQILPIGNETILDFGCGVGRISEWLAPRVKSILAIDTNQKMIDRARSLSTHENVTYKCMRLDEVEGVFDFSLAIFVLQYCEKEKQEEIQDILKRLSRRVLIINHEKSSDNRNNGQLQ